MSDVQPTPYQETRMSFKRSQLAKMPYAEYQRLRPQILAAAQNGDIEDDISTLNANAQEQMVKRDQRLSGESGAS